MNIVHKRLTEPRHLPATSKNGLVTVFLFLTVILHSTNTFAKNPRVPLVVVDKAQTQTVIKQVPLTGTVTSSRVSRLSSEVSGQVSSLFADIGDRVNVGDKLLQLDEEIEALNLKASRSATQQSREELVEAKRRFKSGKQLRKQGGISKEELDQRQANVKIAEAALQRHLAQQQKQQAIVQRHTITAPFAGAISEKHTEVGEWIDTGKPVMTLVAIDQLQIDYQVPQELYSQIDETSVITITLDAIPDKSFEGKIDALVPVSDPDARTFLVRTRLNNQSIHLTPGMSAQGMLRISTGQPGVVVPRDAIMRYRDGRVVVWVVKTEGDSPRVYEQIVKVGHGFSGKVSILEGLQAGTTVVIQGNEALKNGQTIRIHGQQ